MFVRNLKQLTLFATTHSRRRNVNVVWRPRFYASPALCQSLTTPKSSSKRLSRDERRVLVVSFVSKYRAANDGKFPTADLIRKEVGGSHYILRDILQELKLKPYTSLPIVSNAPSQVSAASLPNDQTLAHTSSTCNAKHSSPEVDSSDKIETGSDHRLVEIDSSLVSSDETSLQGNNLVITAATHDKGETETAPMDEVDSDLVITARRCEAEIEASHIPESTSIVLEVSFKNSETEEVPHLGSHESQGEQLERASNSENRLPTETRLVTEKEAGEVKTGEKSSAWSSIISFAKDFANFWRKG